jgi:hypothetical protein
MGQHSKYLNLLIENAIKPAHRGPPQRAARSSAVHSSRPAASRRAGAPRRWAWVLVRCSGSAESWCPVMNPRPMSVRNRLRGPGTRIGRGPSHSKSRVIPAPRCRTSAARAPSMQWLTAIGFGIVRPTPSLSRLRGLRASGQVRLPEQRRDGENGSRRKCEPVSHRSNPCSNASRRIMLKMQFLWLADPTDGKRSFGAGCPAGPLAAATFAHDYLLMPGRRRSGSYQP